MTQTILPKPASGNCLRALIRNQCIPIPLRIE